MIMDKKVINNSPAGTTQQEKLLKNVRGTFAAEGMILSENCLENLNRIANGQASGQQVLTELKAKYQR